MAAEQHERHYPGERGHGKPGLRRFGAGRSLGAVRLGDLRCPPGWPAAEHQALPGETQPLRAGQLQLAVTVFAIDDSVHDLAQRRHRHHPGLQRRDRHVLQQGGFRQGRISSTPVTWADFLTDLGKLKSAGITPFLFTTGAPCNPSWFERLATSSLLARQISKFDVNHAQVTDGLDVAVGIKKGIIGMHNPRYAEIWKLLGQLATYSAGGRTSSAASALTSTCMVSPAPGRTPIIAASGDQAHAVGRAGQCQRLCGYWRRHSTSTLWRNRWPCASSW